MLGLAGSHTTLRCELDSHQSPTPSSCCNPLLPPMQAISTTQQVHLHLSSASSEGTDATFVGRLASNCSQLLFPLSLTSSTRSGTYGAQVSTDSGGPSILLPQVRWAQHSWAGGIGSALHCIACALHACLCT